MPRLEKFHLLCIALAALSLVLYVYGFFNREFIAICSNLIFPMYGLFPTLTAYNAARKYGLTSILGRTLFAFFLGLLAWTIGEVAWSVYVLVYGLEIPFPSIADVFYLLGYPLLFFGLSSYLIVFKDALNKKIVSISSIMGTVVVIVTGVLVIPELLYSSSNLLEGILSLLYPTFDAVLVILSIMGVMIFLGGRISTSWILLSIGFILLGIVDISYYYQNLLGLIWEGHPVELFWLWVYIFLAVAFYSHSKQI